MQSIKSMHVRATDMHDCMQLKVKTIVFHAQSTEETSLIKVGVAHDDRSRSFSTIANYAGCINLTVSCIKTSCQLH